MDPQMGDAAWRAAMAEILARVELAQPDQVAQEVNAAIRPLGIQTTLYLADYEQRRLWAVPEPGKQTSPPLSIDGSIAGRAFTTVRSIPAGEETGPLRMWVPMVDDSERLGVADVLVIDPGDSQDALDRHSPELITLISLVAHLVTTKMPYGDELHRIRRTEPLSTSAELLTSMLPPLTFSCHKMVVSALLEPAYDVGGDAFDYAIDGSLARFFVFDAMGHGLQASLTAAVALAALRTTRRDGQGLYAMARAVDTALVQQFSDMRFVTAVLGELNLDTGMLRYINAGHPPPLLLRRGKAVRALGAGRRLPLGFDDSAIIIGEEQLEPEDRLLLYTDGVVEARDGKGNLFGVDRLVDIAERSAISLLPAPETLRRMAHGVSEHQAGNLTDDATIMLVEWSRVAGERTRP
jgi:serine/threonine protein phosphatase PrpC